MIKHKITWNSPFNDFLSVKFGGIGPVVRLREESTEKERLRRQRQGELLLSLTRD